MENPEGLLNSNLPKNIGKPATRALIQAGLVQLEQLATVTEADLLKLHGVGPKAVRLLKQALEDEGLSFVNQI
ncbi:DNA-directed RNA polymerase alpha subunit [Cytobacillus purgationiresistens]|uniref:DNA-directed RNA polymerase alpha subunit n=1 Tax=Cytobacillus purgationiresistens TaxID=863449 RepID=A0ABU0ANG0_9BACI|nr:DNA-directed RNA polymerase alpha subunit [Cytobacillus purgationiresistens]